MFCFNIDIVPLGFLSFLLELFLQRDLVNPEVIHMDQEFIRDLWSQLHSIRPIIHRLADTAEEKKSNYCILIPKTSHVSVNFYPFTNKQNLRFFKQLKERDLLAQHKSPSNCLDDSVGISTFRNGCVLSIDNL